MLDTIQQDKIRKAFNNGCLRVRSVSPQGDTAWKRVEAVHRHDVGSETIVEVSTLQGSAVLTGGHRVFLSSTKKIEAEHLRPGDTSNGVQVQAVRKLPARQCMYDITAADWHNFVLYRSGLLVSNSPDRNYHFRPPAHEETIRQYNKVFGYIWEDYELGEFIERSLDMIVASPPRTPFTSVDQLCQSRPEWRTMLLTGGMIYALNALRLNWIADEFSVAPETEVCVRLPDGRRISLPIAELHAIVRGDGES